MKRPPLSERNELALFARNMKLAIGIIATGLAFLFGWLQFKGFDLQYALGVISPDLVWKLALTLYYISWLAGTKYDTDVQEMVFVTIGVRRPWPLQSLGVLILLGGVGAVLCWAEGNLQRFAIALVAFMFIDHIAWRYLIKFLRPATLASEASYRSVADYISLEKLRVVVYQVQGNWKWWRLCVGGPLTALIVAFAFYEPMRSMVLAAVAAIGPSLPLAIGIPLMNGVFVMIFVVAVETWHWVIRVKTMVSLELLDVLDERYSLRSKRAS